jgi:hypothetical protein
MMWVLTSMTMLVLVVIALLIKDIAKVPAVARPAALSVRDRPAAAGSPRPRHVAPSPSASAPRSRSALARGRHVTDISSGLSYRLLSSPWRPGCPDGLNTPMFSWSAGESALAGHAFVAGSPVDWYGNACSGPLRQQFRYSGVTDLEPTAMSLVEALDLAYYSWVPHSRTLQGSSEIQVSGHPAWMVTFLMTYPDGPAQGLAWSSEACAVVVVDRGVSQVPVLFYASVPNDLGPTDLGILIRSLRLSN